MPRGRDRNLIAKRNEALLRRYYFWTEVQRLRFDDTLKVLSEQEFFISEERVMAIIREMLKNPLIDLPVKALPRVKMPKISSKQLALFIND